MPEIILGQRVKGERNVALVDEQDADLAKFSWSKSSQKPRTNRWFRVVRRYHTDTINPKTGKRVYPLEFLHHTVAARIWPDWYEYALGFANGNFLDCRRSNIVRLYRFRRFREKASPDLGGPAGPANDPPRLVDVRPDRSP